MRRNLRFLGSGLVALTLQPAAAQAPDGMDLDGDGSVSVEELLSYGRERPDVDAYWSIYDYDLSGQVTAQEYAEAEAGLLEGGVPNDAGPRDGSRSGGRRRDVRHRGRKRPVGSIGSG